MTKDKMICDGDIGCGEVFEMPGVETVVLDGGDKRLYFECPHCNIKRPIGWRSKVTSDAEKEVETDLKLFADGNLSHARFVGRWNRRDKAMQSHYAELVAKYKDDDRLCDII